MPPAKDADIANYYDANTGKFLRFGGSGDMAAIHRAIWAPGVSSREQAFQYLNERVAEFVQPLAERFPDTLRVLDLGCGVGGTATWLYFRLGVDVLGISISESQIRLANERAQRSGCGDHVTFVSGSFESFTTPEKYHAACAIESFVHCQHPGQFLNMARDALLPGGRLVICDDFVDSNLPPEANVWIQQFRRGWQINQLPSREELLALAGEAGFRLVETIDLSAYTRSFPKVLLFILSYLTRLPLPGSYWQNLAGGTALQVCLQRSYTRYHVIVLERI
jgi:SAM-dependent methyltransferase